MAAVTESLHRAIKHHEAGQLDQAEALYREIVRVDPGHADALHLLGVAAHQKSDHPSGVDFIRQAIAKSGGSALYYSNLGACYRALKRYDEAIAAFREAVRLQPGFVGASYNLAMALEAAGSPHEALQAYDEVLRLNSGYVEALNNRGALLSSLGRTDQAIESYRRAVACRPRAATLRYNLANSLSRCGHFEAATDEYRAAIRLDPAIAEAHNNLATALDALGRHEEALQSLERALALRPDYAEARINEATIRQGIRDRAATITYDADSAEPASVPVASTPAQWCARGSQLQASDRFAEADALFRRALQFDPNCAVAYFGLGYGLLAQEKHEEAATFYEQGLLLDDSDAASWNNLGSVYTALENYEAAVACYESALQIDAAYAKAHFNLGNVYKDIGQASEASACYRRAIYVEPELAEAHINLGVVLQQQGRLSEALDCHDRAVQLRPDDAEAHFHRAGTLLLMGDYERGWDEYEWRWRYDLTPRDFTAPAWNGSDLSDQTILIHCEQGVGDEIFFASCVPDVLALSRQCLIECDARLVPLFARSFPLAEVVARTLSNDDAEASGVTVQTPAGSLPRFLRRSAAHFPKRLRYLAACPKQRREFSRRLGELGHGLKVGISWRGGGKVTQHRRRSTELALWRPVFAVPGVKFVNLQYGTTATELEQAGTLLGAPLHHWSDVDPLRDLDAFAAQVAELDLVISVDNATVHMAGALGVPVWNLLPFAPTWRWLLDQDQTAWYPSMRLVRQPAFGDWDSVFEAVSEQLKVVATSQGSKSEPATRGASWSLTPHSVTVAAAGAVQFDAQAAEERSKYEQVWKHDTYRNFSPGADALDRLPLLDALRDHHVRTILDAGCGSGKLMWRLMQEHAGEFNVHGFDITDNCLDPCFAEIKERVLTIGCLWNPDDFQQLYDAVICCDVMEHIPTERVPAVLANLSKSARRFAFFSIAVIKDVFGPQLIGEALHLTVQKPEWWLSRLKQAGFKITSHALGISRDGTEAQLYVFATT
ncbi:MAG TPA: tetratricopeptide repeat protein [Planctomycetaceae bacterium]|nr:tetratricopeptide repeat protein [Planctomycetaceae bacterium]